MRRAKSKTADAAGRLTDEGWRMPPVDCLLPNGDTRTFDCAELVA